MIDMQGYERTYVHASPGSISNFNTCIYPFNLFVSADIMMSRNTLIIVRLTMILHARNNFEPRKKKDKFTDVLLITSKLHVYPKYLALPPYICSMPKQSAYSLRPSEKLDFLLISVSSVSFSPRLLDGRSGQVDDQIMSKAYACSIFIKSLPFIGERNHIRISLARNMHYYDVDNEWRFRDEL